MSLANSVCDAFNFYSSYVLVCLLSCRKGGKLQKRGKINLIGRLQLTTEKTKEEDNDSIVALRVLRTQVCV